MPGSSASRTTPLGTHRRRRSMAALEDLPVHPVDSAGGLRRTALDAEETTRLEALLSAHLRSDSSCVQRSNGGAASVNDNALAICARDPDSSCSPSAVLPHRSERRGPSSSPIGAVGKPFLPRQRPGLFPLLPEPGYGRQSLRGPTRPRRRPIRVQEAVGRKRGRARPKPPR